MISVIIRKNQIRERKMNRLDVFNWVNEEYGTEPDYPWKDDSAVLRHRDNNKWYGLVMKVGVEKLGIAGDGIVNIINVKCDPVLIGSLRTQEGFFPAYHMNKNSWITIILDNPALDDKIKNLIDLSYKMTASRRNNISL